MTEDLKGLIEKIQKEGVQAAEEKARSIEAEAAQKSKNIIAQAKKEAERLIQEAKEEIARREKSSQAALAQAGRDMLLTLKSRINAMLAKLIAGRIREALSPEETAKIIVALIKEYCHHKSADITVTLKKEDFEQLKSGFLSQLADDVKKGVTLKPSEEITGGFVISFDSGKSYFDFTDRALADFIGLYLKPQLEEILNSALDTNNKT